MVTLYPERVYRPVRIKLVQTNQREVAEEVRGELSLSTVYCILTDQSVALIYRDGISASVGSCGAASGVFLVAGPTGGGNLAAIVNGGFSGIAASGVAGGMVSSGM